MDVQTFIKYLKKKVYRHPKIHAIMDAAVTHVDGYVGNFTTTVKSKGRMRSIKHGAAIIATGAAEYRPTEYMYGKSDKVMTLLEMEGKLAKQEEKLMAADSVVMIQCVGCRNDDRNYCARVCCSGTMKNALKMKALKPEVEIYVLFRDIRTYGFREDYYREAANQNVKFIRFEADDKPQLESVEQGGRSFIRVTAFDPILGKKLELDADAIILAAAVIPAAGSAELGRMFKVPLGPDGFFQEAHVKLRPVDFAAEGVYLCGTAQYPKHLSETITQAYGAAGRALTLLSNDTVVASGAVCAVSARDCVSCGACISVCTYGAISFEDTPRGKKAVVNAVLCNGDGLCVSKCPTAAISLSHFTDDEVFIQIDAALAEI